MVELLKGHVIHCLTLSSKILMYCFQIDFFAEKSLQRRCYKYTPYVFSQHSKCYMNYHCCFVKPGTVMVYQ